MKITAKELATRLSIDYIHAASFLKTMVDLDMAKKSGSIKSGKRGRATVVYELNDSEGIVDIKLDLGAIEV